MLDSYVESEIYELNNNFLSRNYPGYNMVITGHGFSEGSYLVVASNSGPGTNLSISGRRMVSATISIGADLDYEWISAKVGFDVTGSYKVTTANTWTVPDTYKGYTVREAYLEAYLLYQDAFISEIFLGNTSSTGVINRQVGLVTYHWIISTGNVCTFSEK